MTLNDPSVSPSAGEDLGRHSRMIEAVLFAASGPLGESELAARLPEGADIPAAIALLAEVYRPRGVNLVRLAGKWAFRTAPDLAFLLQTHVQEQRRLSRAGMETLAIVAYHQPVTRAEIEDIRGVSVSRGTLDVLLELGWIKMRGRRRSPGRPVTYGTTDAFLAHFALETVADLPGLDELKAAGLLDPMSGGPALGRLPGDALTADEDPLESGEDGETEPDTAGIGAPDPDEGPQVKLHAAE